MFRISIFDVVTGEVVGRSGTDTLSSRNFKNAFERAGGMRTINRQSNLIPYVMDDSLSDGQVKKIAQLLKQYQAVDDTVEYGLEYGLFHDLYLTEDERAALHRGQTRFSESKLQKGLSDLDKFVSRMIQQARHPIYDMMLQGKEVV